MVNPSPARYRATNWSSNMASLRKRVLLFIWLDKDMTWSAPHDGGPRRPAVFPDAAILFRLTIGSRSNCPCQATGMVASLLKMAGLNWAVPDYTAPVSAAEDIGRSDPRRRRYRHRGRR